jgi:hypothetical protein
VRDRVEAALADEARGLGRGDVALDELGAGGHVGAHADERLSRTVTA